MRLLLYLLFALLGYQLAVALEGLGLLPKALGLLSLNRLYLTLAGLLTGVLLAPRLEIFLEKQLRKLKELPPEIPVALTLGATLGLLLANLLTTLLSQVPGFSPYHSLFLAVVLVGLFAYLALGYKDYLRARPPRGGSGKRGERSWTPASWWTAGSPRWRPRVFWKAPSTCPTSS
jgi:uncharacterized protein YacL